MIRKYGQSISWKLLFMWHVLAPYNISSMVNAWLRISSSHSISTECKLCFAWNYEEFPDCCFCVLKFSVMLFSLLSKYVRVNFMEVTRVILPLHYHHKSFALPCYVWVCNYFNGLMQCQLYIEISLLGNFLTQKICATCSAWFYFFFMVSYW